MKVSAGLLALAVTALRSGKVDEASSLFAQASLSTDAQELVEHLIEDNGFVASVSSAFSEQTHTIDEVVVSVSASLKAKRRAALLSDPLDADVLSVAGDEDDEEEEESGLNLDIASFDDDEEDDESSDFESESATKGSPIKLTFV